MNHDKVIKLRSLISSTLVPLIDGDYALLDVPNYGNIGDNLIWEGEMIFLKKYIHYKCVYSANVFNWEERKLSNLDVILFNGGGNWGDLYRVCQMHRLYVTSKYKDKKIIVFPQTAWYNNKELLKSDSEIINDHPNIIVCLRDQASYDLLSRYIDKNKLRLIPDMALFVDVDPLIKKSDRSLFLKRTDTEQKEYVEIPNNVTVSDWPTYYNNRYIYKIWHILFEFKIDLSVKLQKFKITSWLVDPVYGINRRNGRKRYVNIGIRFFSEYNIIYTTRLHGLILGVLMGKEMYIVDNKYNKCLNFYRTWFEDFERIHVL